MTTNASFITKVIALVVVAPAAVACWRIIPETPYANNEVPPCTGNCFAYNMCPQGTVCDSMYILGGADNCTNGTKVVRAIRATNGTSIGGCCVNGTPGGFAPAGATCTQPYATFPNPFDPCLIGAPE